MSNIIEEIWELHARVIYRDGIGALVYEDFLQAAAELCQKQRELCFDAFFDYNENNKSLKRDGNIDEVSGIILNNKLEGL